MNKPAVICSAAMLAGAALIVWGLSLPLAQLPVAGVLRFRETNGGGGPVFAIVAVLLLLSTIAGMIGGRAAITGAWLGGGACGWIGASLLAIHHGAIDHLQQLADGGMPLDVPALIAQIRLERGAIAVACGISLFSCALICSAARRHRP